MKATLLPQLMETTAEPVQPGMWKLIQR